LVCHRQTNSIFFTYHLRYPRQTPIQDWQCDWIGIPTRVVTMSRKA
jgi:hypothetical protein